MMCSNLSRYWTIYMSIWNMVSVIHTNSHIQEDSFANIQEIISMKTYPYHHRYATVRNSKIPLADDCALRAFTIEMASYIQPNSSWSNWTALSESALQMDECIGQAFHFQTVSKERKVFQAIQKKSEDDCFRSVFVHDMLGDDLFDGTLNRPLKTISAALALTRSLRVMHGNSMKLCITIRGGIYYLGSNATTESSQIGAIALTSLDSNLIIENYKDERVVLSGGSLLQLQWSVHKKTTNGNTIMKASLPPNIKLDDFNELYIDEHRAIVAKYPNGDPSTQGLYAQEPGFSYNAEFWWPSEFNESQEIHINEPFRNGTYFSHYQIGLNGGASVFNPPSNFWSTAKPPAGHNYAVPRGFTVKHLALPHMKNWTKSTTGLVHAFHSLYWGSWIFQIQSIHPEENRIMFGRGGFQEARGHKIGGPFYIANIFEELDSPNEWFLDKDSRILYLMPNGTMPDVFVASQIPCLISIRGNTTDNPVSNITIQGLILTHTSNTYLRDYMVPSGGDWSVHRGGTIFLTNTTDITITENLFINLGSNAIAAIDSNEATSIELNEFVWLGDSAVVLVGTTNGIDGFTRKSQPTNVFIRSNLMHETGIYVKQSAPVLVAVCRSVSIIGNLMFNVPRAAVNINDGFYGNHTISWNVMFNTVRETSDHGPINTWDRQPFLTDARQAGVPSLWQHPSFIHHNLLVNNYNSFHPIDHDDGSCFYEDSYNFQIYGGKKNYLGHSKIDHHEIYVFPDAKSTLDNGVCLVDQAPKRGSSGWNESWINNTCILYSRPIPYDIWYCDAADLFVPYLADNKIYIPRDTEAEFLCEVDGVSTTLRLMDWQALGLDIGTVIQTTPNIDTIVQWGRDMLQEP